jgi:uncharacterized protein (DUF697 family)
VNTEVENKDQKSQESDRIIRNYAIGSMVPCLLPIPVLDLAVVTGVQLKMLHSLAQIYGVPFKKELGRSAIASLLGGTVALSTARVVSSAVKAVPVVGSIVGAFTMPVVNGGSTYGVGKVFEQHFESGGTLLNFDPIQMRDYFNQQFEEGKKFVSAAQVSGEKSAEAEKQSIKS